MDVALLPALSRAFWVADVLRDRLYRQELKPGDWIREGALMVEFGVSNGPIREALQALAVEGLVERVPHRGVRVVALDEREKIELFQFRAALLEAAAELATRRQDPEALAEVPEILKKIDDGERLGPRARVGGGLTLWLFKAAGNQRYSAAWKQVATQSQIFFGESLLRTQNPAALYGIGRALVKAVVEGDVVAARAAARAMTIRVLNELGFPLFPEQEVTKPEKV